MATTLPVLSSLLLFAIPCALASPISHIGTPEIGTLSLTELAQQTFRRILELGFLRGVLASLLVLSCLVCLLICSLSGLAAYLRRNDRQSWDQLENVQQESEREKKQMFSWNEGTNEDIRHSRRTPPRSRIIRYIFPPHSPPVTKNSIGAASPRQTAGLSSKPSSPSRSTSTASMPQTPSLPLRSALCKSPPPSHRFAKAQTFLFGRIRSSPIPSPKSVRWADELQVFVLANVEMNVEPLGSELETDIGLRRASNDGIDDNLDLPSTLTAVEN